MTDGEGLTKAESIIYGALVRGGATVYRHGWPDFLCSVPYVEVGASNARGQRVFAVEVKSGSDKVSARQLAVHQVLHAVGVPTYVLKPGDVAEEGFTSPAHHYAARKGTPKFLLKTPLPELLTPRIRAMEEHAWKLIAESDRNVKRVLQQIEEIKQQLAAAEVLTISGSEQ